MHKLLIIPFLLCCVALKAQFNGELREQRLTSNQLIDETRPDRSVAIDPCGNHHMVYVNRYYDGPSAGFSKNRICYAFKPKDGLWESGIFISDTNTSASNPIIQLHPVSHLPYVVYQQDLNDSGKLILSFLTKTAQWETVQITNNQHSNYDPDFEFTHNNLLALTWMRGGFPDQLIYFGLFSPETRSLTNLIHIPLPAGHLFPLSPKIELHQGKAAHIFFRAAIENQVINNMVYAYSDNNYTSFNSTVLNHPNAPNAQTIYPKISGNKLHVILGARKSKVSTGGFYSNQYLVRDLPNGTWSAANETTIYSGDASELFIDDAEAVHYIMNRIDNDPLCVGISYCLQTGYMLYITNKSGSWETYPLLYDMGIDPPLIPGENFLGQIYFDESQQVFIPNYRSDNLNLTSHEVLVLSNERPPVKEPEYIEEEKIPNIFTPNGDGINDLFDYTLNRYSTFELHIFNRWGNSVFQSNNQDIKWDATVNGNKVPAGTYYYILTTNYVTRNDCALVELTQTQTRKGTITVTYAK